MLILVLGDLHIPQRKIAIPEQFLKLIVPGKIDKVLCVGNLTTQDQLNWLKSICKDITLVSGDFDEKFPDASETSVVTIGSFKFGLIHGHQILPWGDPERLAAVGREMNADILISGQTHIPSISSYEGRLYINPGSITGAFSNTSTSSVPSFMILDVKKDQMTITLYQVNESGEVEIFNYNHNIV